MSNVFYQPNQLVSLATKHGKERAVSRPLHAVLGFRIVVAEQIDTDAFGTFTGEIERRGNLREVLLQKARLGMEITGLSLGIASEGSFGPHPSMPFIAADHELIIFVDDVNGFHVIEQIFSTETNYAQTKVSSFNELKEFLKRAGFPNHVVIARPNDGLSPEFIFKGLQKIEAVADALEICRTTSSDRIAHVETDMRAHLNPTRMRIIRRLAVKLARRLRMLCPACAAPGFGIIGKEYGLPCRICRTPTDLASAEIHGCHRCDYKIKCAGNGDLTLAEPLYCPVCNP